MQKFLRQFPGVSNGYAGSHLFQKLLTLAKSMHVRAVKHQFSLRGRFQNIMTADRNQTAADKTHPGQGISQPQLPEAVKKQHLRPVTVLSLRKKTAATPLQAVDGQEPLNFLRPFRVTRRQD